MPGRLQISVLRPRQPPQSSRPGIPEERADTARPSFSETVNAHTRTKSISGLWVACCTRLSSENRRSRMISRCAITSKSFRGPPGEVCKFQLTWMKIGIFSSRKPWTRCYRSSHLADHRLSKFMTGSARGRNKTPYLRVLRLQHRSWINPRDDLSR